MKVFTTPTFERHAKKLHLNEKEALDRAVREIMQKPNLGELKRGDLAGVFIYKYKSNVQLWLLAYRVDNQEGITLLLVGPHENFYQSLKMN